MIKLTRADIPSYLSREKIEELTEKYISDNSSVWNKKEIKNTLFASSNNKCAYCECKLQKADSYCEVEHFYPKSIYPNKVIDWDNLLPSCKRCNISKSDHDTGKEKIINPYEDLPKEHLCIQVCRLYPKNESQVGRSTIDILNLNDLRLCKPRFELCNEISEKLEQLKTNNNVIQQKNQLKKLLISCGKSGEFSAFCSHTIHTNKDYNDIKVLLSDNCHWDKELEDLDRETKLISLDTR